MGQENMRRGGLWNEAATNGRIGETDRKNHDAGEEVVWVQHAADAKKHCGET